MSDEQISLPFVSVIVPVRNDEQRIGLCLEALLAQTYPRERYEIIVVDNGSSDRTPTIIQRFPVLFLTENETRSSYAARNKGLAHAKGEIVAFTDSDCVPVPQWIAEGVHALQTAQADLAGGNVRFLFSPRPTGAEVFDSITNMRIEQGIRERGVVKTANLFTRAALFDSVGLFPSEVQSGGDVIWTGRATAAGHRLVYAPQAEVAHPTRRLQALLEKSYRVGRGQRAIRAAQRANNGTAASGASGGGKRKGKLHKLRSTVRGFLPGSLHEVQRSMRQHEVEGLSPAWRVWAVVWLCNIATSLGNLAASRAKTPTLQRYATIEAAAERAAAEQASVHLYDLLARSARAALQLQAGDGSFPAGQNGPYADRETPVRNTAHWLLTVLHAHRHTGDPALLAAARRAAEYLASPAVRPMDATFLCRIKPERDFCNGLIGQAWVIEALVAAAEQLHEPRYRELARQVFLLHPFDQKAGLWRWVNVEGSYGPFDTTFNHQLWFAASGALIDPSPAGPIGTQVRRFLDKALALHLRVDTSGRIAHFVAALGERSLLRKAVAPALRQLRRLRRKPAMVHKEIGYHAFNLYAFALLKRQMPEHPIWRSPKLHAALRFVATPEYLEGLEDNRYGFPYNPPGIEVAFAMQVFSEHFPAGERAPSWWLEQQLWRCYDPQTDMMQRQTVDAATLAARLYEATRLSNLELRLGLAPAPHVATAIDALSAD